MGTCRCRQADRWETTSHSLAFDRVVDLARGTAENDSTLRGPDEVHQVADFRRLEPAVALDQFQRAAGVVLQQVPVRAAKLADELGTEAATSQADRVDAVDAGAVAD